MSRHTAVTTPQPGLIAGMESMVRRALHAMQTTPDSREHLAVIAEEQTRIRASARHWLMG